MLYITMAALVSALDKMNNIQYGENNHIEYKWSEIQQEQILQLSFQLVRTTDVDKRHELAKKFSNCFKKGSLDERKILIKLLAHTRDIEEGKGEYALSIAIISELAEIEAYREMCASLMCVFVGASTSNVSSQKPMGSWKDMKYLFNELDACPPELVTVINKQLKEDIESMNNTKSCSLLAKWIPREKSKKFGWIHKILAMDYFEHYGHLGWTKRATDKAQTYYRKIVSRLNRYIDTVQIKQCSHTWKSINFDNVTSITMIKQRKAFLNDKSLHDNDRIVCRQHLLQHIEQVKNGTKEMKGKRTGMIDFVKAAIELKYNANNNTNSNTNTNANSNHESERFIINEAWKNNSKDTKSLENMIAMVDTSGSMESENSQPLYSAIGLGIRVAEKSKLGKRIMTFDANPTWINLDNCKDFVDEVHTVRHSGWGMNTNFHKAMELILNQIKVNKLEAADVENLVLVVFSDMQFDAAEKNDEFNNPSYRPSNINGSSCGSRYTGSSCGPNDSSCGSRHHVQATEAATETQTIRQILVKKFHDAGVEICGKGYKMPHILFWNLRSTNGFPELSYQNNVTMLSGYSPMLLNSFMEDGMTGLRDATPWGMLTKMLDKERYNVLESLVK